MTRPGRKPISTRKPVARPAHRLTHSRRRNPYWFRSPFVPAALACIGLVFALLLWAALARHFAPLSNSNRQSFDAIVVLGTPADSDGNPTPELLDRVTEGVHEYQRGIAPQIIVTGAAAHNRFVEADVMARVAEAQGVPPSQVIEEPKALDTIQNVCYSTAIMKNHGWHSAEVVSSTSHLPRVSMIFSHLPVEKTEWRMHIAPANVTPGYYSNAAELIEILKTARYLVWARWAETCTV
jgi:uncharacterized SAM-binding protein YcdF (DUF218 family)